MRHREVKYLAQGHTADKYQNQDVNSDSLASEFGRVDFIWWIKPY